MITVFGSVNMDLVAGVERLPRPGETVGGITFVTAPGGKGANQALAAARAGAPVRMVGAVGQDGFAGPALALLEDEGVDLHAVARVTEPTGTALILVDRAGENVIAVVPGANGTVSAASAAGLDFAESDLLLLQMEVPEAAMAAAAERARAGGAKVMLNAAPYRDSVVPLLDFVTHLVVNEHECALLCAALSAPGEQIEEQVTGLAGRLGMAVITTLGPHGALAVEGGAMIRAPALPVRAVDTVGAGDTFCGYLAAELHQGHDLAAALPIAAAAGSLACTKPGAQPAIPRRAHVDSALPHAAAETESLSPV